MNTKPQVKIGEGGDLCATYGEYNRGVSPAVLADRDPELDGIAVPGDADPQEIAAYNRMLEEIRAEGGAVEADGMRREF